MRPLANRSEPTQRRAFSLVELIVVTVIISLILLIGLPAFNSISLQSNFSKSQQLINGVTTRAHLLAINDRVLTAVRFAPAEWEIDPSGTSGGPNVAGSGKQSLVVYKYSMSPISESNQADVNSDGSPDARFVEYFARIKNGPTATLPNDVWAAPAEALFEFNRDGYEGNYWLRGRLGRFRADAVTSSDNDGDDQLFDADDFLVVFDPERGVRQPRITRSGTATDTREAWPMRSFWVASAGIPGEVRWQRDSAFEVDGPNADDVNPTRPFRRYSASGIALYERSRLAAIGPTVQSNAVPLARRRDAIKQSARTFFVSHTTGSLIGSN